MLAVVGTEREDSIDSVLITAIDKSSGGSLECRSQFLEVCHCALLVGLDVLMHSCLRKLGEIKVPALL